MAFSGYIVCEILSKICGEGGRLESKRVVTQVSKIALHSGILSGFVRLTQIKAIREEEASV